MRFRNGFEIFEKRGTIPAAENPKSVTRI